MRTPSSASRTGSPAVPGRPRGGGPALLSLSAAGGSAGSDGAALDAALAGGRLVAAAPMPPEPEAVVDAAGIRETVLAALAGLAPGPRAGGGAGAHGGRAPGRA